MQTLHIIAITLAAIGLPFLIWGMVVSWREMKQAQELPDYEM